MRWFKCRTCRRVYREHRKGQRCWWGHGKLIGVRRELAEPLEAAWLLGGIEAAQEIATPGKSYTQLAK